MIKKLFTIASCLSVLMFTLSCNNQSDKNASNPFFAESWNTPFAIPPFDQIKPEHFVPAFEEGIRLENEEIASITANEEEPSFENTIEAFVSTGSFLDRVSSVFYNLTSAEVTDTLKGLQKVIIPMMTTHSNEITLNDELFKRIKTVYDKRDSLGLSPEKLRLTEKTYDDFALNGANLDATQKAELKKINQQLSSYSLNFGDNLLKEMSTFNVTVEDESELDGLSQSAKDAALKDGKWVFTLDKPSMIPFLQSCKNRELRKKLYEGYLNRCNYDNATDNKAIIDSIVNTRIKRANLLGFATHADFVLNRNMAKTPANVYALLDEMWTPALKRASGELQEMIDIKFKETGSKEFESWDWWYYAERLREQKYNMSEEKLRPYFSLDATREGIFTLCNKLWGITFVPVENAPVYHSECQVYECIDKDGKHLGALIMDFFPRPGKRIGAWCSSFRGQKYENGQRIAPISTIVCNFTRPNGNTPALLTLDEVETFFHEFGHALHTLFADNKVNGLRGVSRDFVELPSQIMENWALSPELLRIYAKHYETGEVIPENMIQKISDAQLFNQGFMTVEYLAASLLDMDYHTIKNNAPIDVVSFENNALVKRGLMKEIAPRYRSTYFQHIFSGGYSSGYYSYIWAEVLDADAFQAFVETGDVFNQDVAESFRRNVLQVGGSRDEMESYKIFRGKDPDKTPLLKNRGLI